MLRDWASPSCFRSSETKPTPARRLACGEKRIDFLRKLADAQGLGALNEIGWFPRRGLYDIGTLVVGTLIGYQFVRDAGRPALRRTVKLMGRANEGPAKVTAIQTHLGRAPVVAAGLEWNADEAHSAAYDAELTADLFCETVNRFRPIYDSRIES